MGVIALLILAFCLTFWGILIFLALHSIWIAKIVLSFLALVAIFIIAFLLYSCIAPGGHHEQDDDHREHNDI